MRNFLRRAFDRHPVLIFCLTAFTFSWFWIFLSAFWQAGRVDHARLPQYRLPVHGDL